MEIGSRDPGHAHLWVVLWSVRREALPSMSVHQISNGWLFSLKKLLWGPKISKLGHVTLSHALLHLNVKFV